MHCYILRKTGTLKIIKIKDQIDEFNFENGKYFVMRDRIFLKKKRISGYNTCLFYIEGISEPLKLDNIEKMKVPVIDENGDIIMMEDETVLIDARNIHTLTSSNMLSVLSGSNITKFDKVIIILLILSILTSIAGLF